MVGDHRERLKLILVHGPQTLQLISVRMLVAFSAIFNFKILLIDVKLAYLSAYEPLQRKMNIGVTAVELELD